MTRSAALLSDFHADIREPNAPFISPRLLSKEMRVSQTALAPGPRRRVRPGRHPAARPVILALRQRHVARRRCRITGSRAALSITHQSAMAAPCSGNVTPRSMKTPVIPGPMAVDSTMSAVTIPRTEPR